MSPKRLLAGSIAVLGFVGALGAEQPGPAPERDEEALYRAICDTPISERWFQRVLAVKRQGKGPDDLRKAFAYCDERYGLFPPSGSKEFRVLCAMALLRTRATELGPGLLVLLRSKEALDPDVALGAFAEMGPSARSVAPAVIEYYKRAGKNTGGRSLALEALGKMQATEGLPILIEALRTTGAYGTHETPMQALMRFEKIPEEAVAALASLLKHKNRIVRYSARNVLRKLGRDEKDIVRTTNRPASTRTAAVRPAALDLPGRPYCLATYKDRVYVSLFERGVGVAVVDPVAKRIERYLPVDENCCAGRLAIADGKLFVGMVFSPSMSVYGLQTRRLLRKIPVGRAGRLAAAPDGKHVYSASNRERKFHIIDTATYECREVAYPHVGTGLGWGSGIARGCLAAEVSPDGTRLYLALQRPRSVAVYDLKKRRYEKLIHLDEFEQVEVGGSPNSTIDDLAFSSDGKHLFAAMFQSQHGVFIINRLTHEVESNIVLGHPDRRRGGAPLGLATYEDRLLVANRTDNELVILRLAPEVTAITIRFDGQVSGPTQVMMLGHTAVVCHHSGKRLSFIDLREVLREGGRDE